jgi:hypothetical protein
LPRCVAEEEEEIHLVVAEVAEEAEELQLLRSPRPPHKQLSLKQLTFELWEPPQEYSKEIELKQKTSSMSYDIITASTEGSPDSIPP